MLPNIAQHVKKELEHAVVVTREEYDTNVAFGNIPAELEKPLPTLSTPYKQHGETRPCFPSEVSRV